MSYYENKIIQSVKEAYKESNQEVTIELELLLRQIYKAGYNEAFREFEFQSHIEKCSH